MKTQFTKWTRRRALLAGAALISSPSIFFVGRTQWTATAREERLKLEAEKRAQHLKLADEERELRERELYKQLGEKLKKSIDNASQSDLATVQSARKELELELAQYRESALAEVPDIVGQASRFGECVKLIGLMATDKIKGSSKAAEHTAARVEPIRRVLEHMDTTGDSSTLSVCHHINAHSNEISTQLLSDLTEMTKGPGSDIESLNDHLAELSSELEKHQLSLGITASLLPLDILLADYVMRILYRVLGAYASRAATVAGANVILSLADGPLPIGEVIALLLDAGFITWSAWSLYRAFKDIKPGIHQALVDAIDQAAADILGHFDEIAAGLLEQARKNREATFAPTSLTNR